ATGGATLAEGLTASTDIMKDLPEEAEDILIAAANNEIDGTMLNTANSADEGANATIAAVHDGMVASSEEPAAEAGNTAAVVEDIPEPKKGVFGCGNYCTDFCDHTHVTTFSEIGLDAANYTVDFNDFSDITVQEGANTFDQILQEYSRNENYLQLGYDLLKPGGQLHVIIRQVGDDDLGKWMVDYSLKGEGVFGEQDEETMFTKGLDNIKRVVSDFGIKKLDQDTYEWMVTFQKPG
ncbi:MAG: hypothetical protein OXD32_07825, partial [Endozoicomonadaceae bacterium]|nr:hypothetical protein [Endozoicomonadaceae bacterium]